MKSFAALKRNIKKPASGLKRIRVGVLGDSSTQLFTQALKGYGYEAGLDLDLHEAPHDQIELQVFEPESGLYKAKPEFIILFCSVQKLREKFYRTDLAEKKNFAESHIRWIESLYAVLLKKIPVQIICLNFPELNDSVYGNFSNKTELSFVYQLRKINYRLMQLSSELKSLSICDVCSLQGYYGKKFIFDSTTYFRSDMVFSIAFLPFIAKNICDIVLSVCGVFKKCLIMDLDDMIWGGLIGDDGMENIQIGDLGAGKSFSEMQMWIKQLKQRGIILAVCSKNNELTAKEPFEKHPDMILHLDDIAVFVANWRSKAENIQYIRRTLGIGFDSMVFLDDNPFERNCIRDLIPQITVPELPENPGDHLDFLQTLNLFEMASLSLEDGTRTQYYLEETRRSVVSGKYPDEHEFLKSLHMVSHIEPANKFNLPRLSQLSQRSNQFNLRTIRYTEEEIGTISQAADTVILSFTLNDKYGESGIICLVILKKKNPDTLFIDTWLMSCRVLNRRMDCFTLNAIAKVARVNGIKNLTGEYIPTHQNSLVRDHFFNLGFVQTDGSWTLDMQTFEERPCLITALNTNWDKNQALIFSLRGQGVFL